MQRSADKYYFTTHTYLALREPSIKARHPLEALLTFQLQFKYPISLKPAKIMTSPTIVFITGVGRGIGRQLIETYLARPNTTVIGSVRDKASATGQTLSEIPTAIGSKLIVVSLEVSEPTAALTAVKEIQAAGIDHLDIVIANAGITGPPGFASIDVVTAEALTECFRVNTLGPIFLFQATKSLLEKSKDPKWVVVSTYISSIGLLGTNGMHVAPAYGISKAGVNWATV